METKNYNESYRNGYREGVLDAHCNQIPARVVDRPETFDHNHEQFLAGYRAAWKLTHDNLNHRRKNEFCVWHRNTEYRRLYNEA